MCFAILASIFSTVSSSPRFKNIPELVRTLQMQLQFSKHVSYASQMNVVRAPDCTGIQAEIDESSSFYRALNAVGERVCRLTRWAGSFQSRCLQLLISPCVALPVATGAVLGSMVTLAISPNLHTLITGNSGLHSSVLAASSVTH